MFATSIRNAEAMVKYLEKFNTNLEEILTRFDTARRGGTLTHFMHWNGIELHRGTTQADLANRYLQYFADDSSSLDMEGKFEMITSDVERKIENLTISFMSTSSNPSANAEKLYEMAFYLEIKACLKNY